MSNYNQQHAFQGQQPFYGGQQQQGYQNQPQFYGGQQGYQNQRQGYGDQQLIPRGYNGGQEQSEWVMVLYSSLLRFELIDRFPGSDRRPYYVHTPTGYMQYEYPTTMTAWENGLYSQGGSSQAMCQRQSGQGSGFSEFRASGQYYPPSPHGGFGSQRGSRHRFGNEGWGNSGNQGYY